MQTQIVIRSTRRVRDLARGRRFVVERRFPGGRTIEYAKTATRTRAFDAALMAARPQTSETAGAGINYNPDAGAGGGGIPAWQGGAPGGGGTIFNQP